MSRVAAKPTFLYLDVRPRGPLGGRGNAARLFFLANKIPFENKLQPMDSWMDSEKQRFTKEGINPLGHLPVLFHEGRNMPETIAIARFLARKHGLYGKDADLDYETDATADAYQEWRNAWASALMGSDDDKKAYDGKRSFYLNAMECYYKNRSAQDSPFLVQGDLPGFADTAVFNMIRDDAVVMGKHPLDDYPHLKAMYEKCDAVPEVRKWIEDWEAREV